MDSLPLKAAQLSIGYDRNEDRLMLLATNAAGETIALPVTRRLVARMINAFAKLLEMSSAIAQQAPSEMRDDVILLEHQEALSGQQSGPKAATESPTTQKQTGKKVSGQTHLVQNIQVTTKPNGFDLVLKDAKQPLAKLTANRKDLHRILETLLRNAEAADWQITIDASWLDPEDSEVVVN